MGRTEGSGAEGRKGRNQPKRRTAENKGPAQKGPAWTHMWVARQSSSLCSDFPFLMTPHQESSSPLLIHLTAAVPEGGSQCLGNPKRWWRDKHQCSYLYSISFCALAKLLKWKFNSLGRTKANSAPSAHPAFSSFPLLQLSSITRSPATTQPMGSYFQGQLRPVGGSVLCTL